MRQIDLLALITKGPQSRGRYEILQTDLEEHPAQQAAHFAYYLEYCCFVVLDHYACHNIDGVYARRRRSQSAPPSNTTCRFPGLRASSRSATANCRCARCEGRDAIQLVWGHLQR